MSAEGGETGKRLRFPLIRRTFDESRRVSALLPLPESARMLTMLGSPRRTCDGVTRRETLAAGALTLLGSGFTLPNLLAAEAKKAVGARPGKAKNVILLYLL